MLMWGYINASNTGHDFPLNNFTYRKNLTLPLLVSRVSTNNADHPFSTDDLAIPTHLFHRRSNLHQNLQSPLGIKRNIKETILVTTNLLRSENNSCPAQVIGSQLNSYFISGQNTNVVHPHLSRNVPENNVPVFEFYPKRRIWKIFNNLSLHLNNVIFRHAIRLKIHLNQP